MRDQDTVALVIDKEHEMSALVALERLVHVDRELGEEFERLAPLVCGIDGERAIEHRQRFRIAALVKFYPRIEIQSGRRLGVFLERLGGQFFGLGDAPGIQPFFTGLELRIRVGAQRRGRQKKPKHNHGEKRQSVLQWEITRRDF